MKNKRHLIIADQSSNRQTFIADSLKILLAEGLEYKTILTRGPKSEPSIDNVLAANIDALNENRHPLFYSIYRAFILMFSSREKKSFIKKAVRWNLGKQLAVNDIHSKALLYDKIKHYDPSIIISHFVWNAPLALAIAETFGIKVILIAHGSDVLREESWHTYIEHPLIIRIFAVSEALKFKIQQKLDSDQEKVQLLNNPLNPLYLSIIKPPPTERLEIVCIAALRRLKNHAWLLRALAKLKSQNIDFRCRIIGSDFNGEEGLRLELKTLCAQLSIEKRVVFEEWLDPSGIINAIDQANVVTLTSESEGYGMVIAEAIARERCPVGSNIPSIAEAMDGGQYGILCKINDDDELASGLIEGFKKTIHERDTMKAGRTWVEKKLSHELYKEKIFSVLNQT